MKTSRFKEISPVNSVGTGSEEELSLRAQYEAKQAKELKIERRPVALAMRVWNFIRFGVGGVLALIGVVSLIHPGLRIETISLFQRFLYETGIFL